VSRSHESVPLVPGPERRNTDVTTCLPAMMCNAGAINK